LTVEVIEESSSTPFSNHCLRTPWRYICRIWQ